jgi:hypothetical protein
MMDEDAFRLHIACVQFTTHLSHAADWEWQTKSTLVVACALFLSEWEIMMRRTFTNILTHAWNSSVMRGCINRAAPPIADSRAAESAWAGNVAIILFAVSATLFNRNRTAGAFNLGRDSVKFTGSFKQCQKSAFNPTLHGLMFWINSRFLWVA